MINKKPHFTYILKDGVEPEGIGMCLYEENILSLLEQAKSEK